MKTLEIRTVLENEACTPKYATLGASAADVHANIKEPITIGSLERTLIPTGIKMEIPVGYEVQVRPRSGLARKHGITVINSPGTIDSDYRGDIGVILVNLSKDPYTINPMERIGQIVLQEVCKMELVPVNDLSKTARGDGGFGHTGK